MLWICLKHFLHIYFFSLFTSLSVKTRLLISKTYFLCVYYTQKYTQWKDTLFFVSIPLGTFYYLILLFFIYSIFTLLYYYFNLMYYVCQYNFSHFHIYIIYSSNINLVFLSFNLFNCSLSTCLILFEGVGKSSGIVPPISSIAFLTFAPTS